MNNQDNAPSTIVPMPESVYELPHDFAWDAQAVCDYIKHHWSTTDEKCTLFDMATGLYWYCYDYHSGQGSAEYSIMSAQLDYSPGACASGPEEGGACQYVYDLLVSHNQAA